jgi:hypothetical protein
MSARATRRRPSGYRGSDLAVLKMLHEDARAALAYARELRVRAATEDVTAELFAESRDSEIRAVEMSRRAGKGYPTWIYSIAALEEEASAERLHTMFAAQSSSYERYFAHFGDGDHLFRSKPTSRFAPS